MVRGVGKHTKKKKGLMAQGEGVSSKEENHSGDNNSVLEET